MSAKSGQNMTPCHPLLSALGKLPSITPFRTPANGVATALHTVQVVLVVRSFIIKSEKKRFHLGLTLLVCLYCELCGCPKLSLSSYIQLSPSTSMQTSSMDCIGLSSI